jgi:hypothetical protein
MGADLYITPLYQEQRQKWEPEFEKAVLLRDSCTEGTAEHRQAQAEVEECHNRLNERGYFRDPYNDWDVLWKFGLSWWEDVIPMLDHHSNLSVAEAKNLLAMLKEREKTFDLALAQLPAEDQQYFRRRYAALQEFLHEAIAMGTPIETSL